MLFRSKQAGIFLHWIGRMDQVDFENEAAARRVISGAMRVARSIAAPSFNSLAIAKKRAIEIAGALVFFPVFLPLYVCIAIGVRISSPSLSLCGAPLSFWHPEIQ